ncbi:uncharacterized protein LOC116803889 [Drosophila mojavensis]|uniref:uncharacterized protein LOC116803889 n=1 Tax=Drosophila mojavensis TaxID=7230 RepID=UPI001CD12708|nr:uncharacterized protein LOC116803889 [Drosophila mojavensis]
MSNQHGTFDRNAANVTACDAMRLQNCKAYTFRQGEMYPSIRPAVSRCPPVTDKWMSNVADPKLYSSNNASPVENVVAQKRFDMPRPSNKYVCSQIKQQKTTLDYSKLTPYDLMRMLNCMPADYRDNEIYPSIRPPVSQCCPALTAEYLMDTLREGGCERHFDMEKDDIVEVWRQSPNKESLSYYGVGTGIYKPEAVMFNKAISKCLQMVNPPEPPKSEAMPEKPVSGENVIEPPRYAVLNRPKLSAKVSRMPNVTETLNAISALRWVYCPRTDKERFAPSKPPFPIKKALNMERPRSKSMHELRRKDEYCELQCHIPENTCTQFEWMKYKENKKSYEEKYKQEIEDLEKELKMENNREQEEKIMSDFELGGFGPGAIGPVFGIGEEDLGTVTFGGNVFKFRSSESENKSESSDVTKPIIVPPGVDAGGLLPRKRKQRRSSHRGSGKLRGRKGKSVEPRNYSELYTTLVPFFEYDTKSKLTNDYDSCIASLKDNGNQKISFTPDSSSDEGKRASKTGERKSSVKKGTSDGKAHGKNRNRKGDISEGRKGGNKKVKIGGEIDKTDGKVRQQGDDGKNSGRGDGEYDKSDNNIIEDKSDAFSKDKTKQKKKLHIKIKKTHKQKKSSDSGCPCDICQFMTRRQAERDSPLISQLKRDDKRRQLREYYRFKCYIEQLKCRKPEYPAPQHKCDPIVCNDFFCRNPKISNYCDCLMAMQELQKQLGPKHTIIKNELIFNLEDLKNRLCNRFCECLQ